MKMNELISEFPKQLKESLEIGKKVKVSKPDKPIQNVLVSGLGGSGIGANLVGELVADEIKVPFAVNKDYFIPDFVNENTLVIISSYSGNTEETVNALNLARTKKAKIVCVSSNGKILQIASENDLDHVQIPGGRPPRASLGYSFVQQLFILKELGLISDKRINEVSKAIELIEAEEENIKKLAKDYAEKLHNKFPIIYGTSEAVAVRMRQQLNENSKILACHHISPEMNHNELVGWRDRNNDLAVVFLRNDNDFERNKQRIEISKNIVSNYTDNIYEINSKGESKTERSLYTIQLIDWISYELAQLREHDAVEVKVIDYLKGELAKKEF